MKCKRCNGTRFYKTTRKRDGKIRLTCSACARKKLQKHRRTPVGKALHKIARNRWNAKKLGYAPPKITTEKLVELLNEANNHCMCCGDRVSELHLDHDHKTGKVRGLLCRSCNWAEGHTATRKRWLAIGRYMQWL